MLAAPVTHGKRGHRALGPPATYPEGSTVGGVGHGDWLASPASGEQRGRAELVEKPPRRHARERAELGDEVCLVVVAGLGGDARPVGAVGLARGAKRAMEAAKLREGLGAHSDGFTEHATELPLAHTDVDRDGVHVRARQPLGGIEGESRSDAVSVAAREAVGDVVDDETPDLATLFASAGAPPPDGSNAAFARDFDVLLDGRRIRADLGFKPRFPRLADALATGA